MSKDARFFPHDDNARNDPKIKALIKKHGLEGYGRFWVIVEMMRASTNYRLVDKPLTWDSLSYDFNCDTKEVDCFIEDCVSKFDLFSRDNGFVYSMSLIARMLKLDTLRKKKAKGGYARHGKELPEDWE